MALKGQAKTDWQRAYMRKRRSDPAIQESERESQRIRSAISRAKLKALKELEPKVVKELPTRGKCEICGFALTVDVHHGVNREVHILCPNHHALITRGIKTLEELRELTPSTSKVLDPVEYDADGNVLYDF